MPKIKTVFVIASKITKGKIDDVALIAYDEETGNMLYETYIDGEEQEIINRFVELYNKAAKDGPVSFVLWDASDRDDLVYWKALDQELIKEENRTRLIISCKHSMVDLEKTIEEWPSLDTINELFGYGITVRGTRGKASKTAALFADSIESIMEGTEFAR